MPASDVLIEEVTGADPMRIVLRGRALPYQGLEFSGQQRTATTWYPGNPKATQQVLGVQLEPTEMRGTWKTKFLRFGSAEDYEVTGGGFLESTLPSEDLVLAFEALRDRGVEVRVTWGTVVRYGLLQQFTATWAREEDVEWSATFEWNGATETPWRSGDPTVAGQSVLEGIQGMDDAGAEMPVDSLQFNVAAQALATRQAVRDRALGLLGATRNLLQRTQTGLTAAQSMVSRATYLAADAIGFVSRLRDENYVRTSLVDDVAGVLGVEVWRLRMSGQVLALAAKGAQDAKATELSYQPPAQEVVVVRQRTTLRQLALTAYGDADAWGQIAEANGLQVSVVEAGTRVVIPRRQQPPSLDPTGVL
jgi:hypothetical protein